MQQNDGFVHESEAKEGAFGGDGSDTTVEMFFQSRSEAARGAAVGSKTPNLFSSQIPCSANPRCPLRMLSAIFPASCPGASAFLGDTGAVIYAVPTGKHMCNKRQLRPWEHPIMASNGTCGHR